MIIAAIIVGLIAIGLIFLINHISSSRHAGFDVGVFFGFLTCIFCIIEICIISIIKEVQKPTAIDVYRNKTDLKISSINGVPVDTVVVFKK